MESVLRAAALYLLLLVLVRLTGRRSLRETSAFDLVLLLVIGEATQQALLGEDFSLVNAVLVVVTLLLMDVGLSLLKQRSAAAERVIDGVPTLLVADGKPLEERLRRARVDVTDVLQAARIRHGLVGLEQIRWAVLEADGTISIVPAGEGGVPRR
jgi:uncharacterized membrane protein YcaP (DUF421 family)